MNPIRPNESVPLTPFFGNDLLGIWKRKCDMARQTRAMKWQIPLGGVGEWSQRNRWLYEEGLAMGPQTRGLPFCKASILSPKLVNDFKICLDMKRQQPKTKNSREAYCLDLWFLRLCGIPLTLSFSGSRRRSLCQPTLEHLRPIYASGVRRYSLLGLFVVETPREFGRVAIALF